jgi:chorismate mutase/prephenate dehydratase
MTELEKARQIINETDLKMAELFEKRMDAATTVALYKKEHGLPIDDFKREEELIKRNTAVIQNEEYASYYVNFLQSVIGLSKCLQHRLLDGMRVAYSGVEGAFANIATEKIVETKNAITKNIFSSCLYFHCALLTVNLYSFSSTL